MRKPASETGMTGVNIIFLIIVLNDLSKSFGHGVGFTLGLIFLGFIFLPVLAFGGSKYVGPAARQGSVRFEGWT
jgi:hypothetical protein